MVLGYARTCDRREMTDVEEFSREMHGTWRILPEPRTFNVMIFCDLSWQLFGISLKNTYWIPHFKIYWTHSEVKKFLNCFQITLGKSMPWVCRWLGFLFNTFSASVRLELPNQGFDLATVLLQTFLLQPHCSGLLTDLPESRCMLSFVMSKHCCFLESRPCNWMGFGPATFQRHHLCLGINPSSFWILALPWTTYFDEFISHI